MKPRLGLFVAALFALIAIRPTQAMAQGVVGDFSKPRTEAVGEATPVLGEWVRSEMVSVPADDSGKWQFLVFCGENCSPCEKLKADWKANPNLKALADENGAAWGWLNVYQASNKSQAFRFKDYQVSNTPVIVVAPPANTKLWPYYVVFREEGYNGDADGLAKRMVAAIKAFIAKHRPRPAPDAPSPDLPVPSPQPPLVTPNVPAPAPNPVVPNVLPFLPNFPPLVTPNPTPGPGPAVPGPSPNTDPAYPDGLQVVFVLADPNNILERAELKILRSRLDAFKAKYKLNFDVRILKLADAEKRYPVKREELPAVFVTESGKLVAKVSIGLLQEIIDTQTLDDSAERPNLLADLPAPKREPRTPEERAHAVLRGIGEALAMIPSILGWSGWLLVIAIVVYVVWRRRRPATAMVMTPVRAEPIASPIEEPAAADGPWNSPSKTASAGVSAALAAQAQAAQARDAAAAELARAQATLDKENKAVADARTTLGGLLPTPPSQP